MSPHNASGVNVSSNKKDQYEDLGVEISRNSITFNDYQAPKDKSLSIKTDNNDQAKLVEKWLFEGAKVEDEVVKTDFTGTLTPELLKKIFPNVKPDRSKDILPYINQYLKNFGMNTCEERIMFFTQIAEETDNLGLLTEVKSDWASSTSKYKGRGMFQLTGSRNYKKFGEYCRNLGDDVNFIDNPEKINLPKYAVLSNKTQLIKI